MYYRDAVTGKPTAGSIASIAFIFCCLIYAGMLSIDALNNTKLPYTNCVTINSLDSSTNPKSYTATLSIKSENERHLFSTKESIVGLMRGSAPFPINSADITSYSIEKGACVDTDAIK